MSQPAGASQVTAEYRSPGESHDFVKVVEAPPVGATSKTAEKTSYMAELRQHVSQMQDDINAFLTSKMEQDKAAQSGGISKGKTPDEDKAEALYGEEDPENA